jgi:hypothetical protein
MAVVGPNTHIAVLYGYDMPSSTPPAVMVSPAPAPDQSAHATASIFTPDPCRRFQQAFNAFSPFPSPKNTIAPVVQ